MSDYDVYGVCPCGYFRRAPFGKLFHIHIAVCPRCGRDKDREWDLVTGRVRAVGPRFRKRSVVVPLVAAREQQEPQA